MTIFPAIGAPEASAGSGSAGFGNTLWKTKRSERLCDYIHYNPVKHGHAVSPQEWPWSTFAQFVARGQYDREWGRAAPRSIDNIASIVGE